MRSSGASFAEARKPLPVAEMSSSGVTGSRSSENWSGSSAETATTRGISGGSPASCQRASPSPIVKAEEDSQDRLNGWYISINIHLSFLSDVRNRSNVLPTFGYGVDVGRRWNDKAFFVHIEHSLWLRTEIRKGLALGALSIAPGFDAIYGDGFVHTSIAVVVGALRRRPRSAAVRAPS